VSTPNANVDAATQPAIRDALKSFIEEEIVIGLTVESDTDLLLTGAVDSLGVIRITHWMEENHGVEVDPGDVTLENFQTIEKMSVYLNRSIGL